MTSARHILVVAFVSLLAGCNLVNTSDNEASRGRGAKAFDPYSSTASGAISLSLIQFNGCSVRADGQVVSKGSLTLPDYPDKCDQPDQGNPFVLTPQDPTGVMPVVRGQKYFLNQFIAMDTVFGMHTDYNDRNAPATWIRKSSRFKDLDWTGLSVGREEWRPDAPPTYRRETFYQDAAWMKDMSSTFTLEVLDASGTVRTPQPIVYSRKDFMAENPYSGRTRVSWTIISVLPPQFPGDPTIHLQDGTDPIFQTIAKVAFSTSANPFNSFTMPDVQGEGVIRVTWSALPNKPFLFPVKFITASELPNTCYKLGADGFATNVNTRCSFGLQQDAKFNKPANGKFYTLPSDTGPGEPVDFQISLRDGENNGLHPKDLLPSLNAYRSDTSNGLLYFNDFMSVTLREQTASESGFLVAGPLHKMRRTPTQLTNYVRSPDYGEPHYYADQPGTRDLIPGAADANPPTRFAVPLPPNAEPGTYVLFLKGHRYLDGERLNRLDAFFFQVGQEQQTSYPGRVGNCQICHNGVLSMTNMMHGLSVDHVEGCKACHNENVVGDIADLVHKIHSSSLKYPLPKRDCSVCHLTKESATTPSITTCQGCHPSIHGNNYFDLQFRWVDQTPNQSTDCGSACHVTSVPSQHILPPN